MPHSRESLWIDRVLTFPDHCEAVPIKMTIVSTSAHTDTHTRAQVTEYTHFKLLCRYTYTLSGHEHAANNDPDTVLTCYH